MRCDDPQHLAAFLEPLGLAAAERLPLTGDASSRRYQRLRPAEGPSLILMQAPDPARELVPFVDIAARLKAVELSVPTIMAADASAGLLLLEDFGDQTFAAALDGGADLVPLYHLATDLLIALHRSPVDTAGLPRFDAAAFLAQLLLLPEMVFPGDERCRSEFETAWRAVLPMAVAGPQSLLLRDYHAGNLMMLPERPGVRACGLLDFQDAGAGPIAYDLVSLAEDARRDLPRGFAAFLIGYYLSAFPNVEAPAFVYSASVLAAVRHTRVIAVFLRLARVGKPGYLRHLPRLWRYLDSHLALRYLKPVADWFARYLPPDQRDHLVTETIP